MASRERTHLDRLPGGGDPLRLARPDRRRGRGRRPAGPLTNPVTDHPASDDCGVAILGPEDDKFWHDHKGAGVNAVRTQTLLREADVVVVRFGEKYKQWNAAFDAGQAAALGKPLITLHPPEHDHALKEVDRAALAVAREPEQVAADPPLRDHRGSARGLALRAVGITHCRAFEKSQEKERRACPSPPR